MTFTNEAAREMCERMLRLTAAGDHTRFAIATFHSICAGILRREAHRVGLTSRFAIATFHSICANNYLSKHFILDKKYS